MQSEVQTVQEIENDDALLNITSFSRSRGLIRVCAVSLIAESAQ